MKAGVNELSSFASKLELKILFIDALSTVSYQYILTIKAKTKNTSGFNFS